MDLLGLFMIAAGLSMDAFAAAVCRGLRMKKMQYGDALLTAVLFGGFQGLMPLIGWLLGVSLEDRIKSVDHWVAFALLSFIGIKMIADSLKEGEGKMPPSDLKGLFLMALATSIDALAVGITFAFLGTDRYAVLRRRPSRARVRRQTSGQSGDRGGSYPNIYRNKDPRRASFWIKSSKRNKKLIK